MVWSELCFKPWLWEKIKWAERGPDYTHRLYGRINCLSKINKKLAKGDALTHDCGEGDGTPLQYSCLEGPMDRGAWWAAVHGVTKSRT